MHRQQLDRGDAEVAQVVGDRGMREAGVRAPQVLGHPFVERGEALDVQLVDDSVAPAPPQLGVVAPVEVVMHDHAPGDVRRRVAVVCRRRRAERSGVTSPLTARA